MNDFLGKLTKDIAKNDNKQHRNICIMVCDKYRSNTYNSRDMGDKEMMSDDEIMALIYSQWSVIVFSIVVGLLLWIF